MSIVSHAAIDPTSLLREVADAGSGASLLFLGTVRSGSADGPVQAIEYSAYEDMAVEEFSRITQEALEQWPTVRVAFRHRFGRVPVGEPSIAVAVSAPHRAEAFAAGRWLIDEAKRRLPVWKHEEFEDGSRRWKEEESPSHPLQAPGE